MTRILDILRREESETLEFKESFGREAIETISAFANTKGGVLLVGVNDKGAVVGIHGGVRFSIPSEGEGGHRCPRSHPPLSIVPSDRCMPFMPLWSFPMSRRNSVAPCRCTGTRRG